MSPRRLRACTECRGPVTTDSTFPEVLCRPCTTELAGEGRQEVSR